MYELEYSPFLEVCKYAKTGRIFGSNTQATALYSKGSSADERDLDEARIFNRADSFMESLGLKQLH